MDDWVCPECGEREFEFVGPFKQDGENCSLYRCKNFVCEHEATNIDLNMHAMCEKARAAR
jgi:hypothetical protein